MQEMFPKRYIASLAPSEELVKGLRNSSHLVPPRIIEKFDHKPVIRSYADTFLLLVPMFRCFLLIL